MDRFPGYVACSDGEIYKFKKDAPVKLNGTINQSGYRQYGLGGKTVLGHRLIALAFCDNKMNKPQVNHKNLNKEDNRPENLEWATPKENTSHAWENWACSHYGDNCKFSKIDEVVAIKIKEAILEGISTRAICKKYGVSGKMVYDLKLGKTWKHTGVINKSKVKINRIFTNNKKTICLLLDGIFSQREVSKIIKIDQASISRFLKKWATPL